MSMATAEPMIEINDLWKAFGALQVLKGISLDVPGRSAVALIGPSGAGKSTLLRCINLLEQPDRGRVRVGDQTIDCAGAKLPDDKQLAGFRARTGMVFQLFNLFPHMTAVENVSAGPRFVKKMQPNEAKDMAMAFLAKVGLADGERISLAPLVGRSAAARCHCPRARHEFGSDPVRRGDLRARSGVRRRGPRSNSRIGRGRHDHGAGDA